MADKLPAAERIRILTGRIANLNKGSGDYDMEGRLLALRKAKVALDDAKSEQHNG